MKRTLRRTAAAVAFLLPAFALTALPAHADEPCPDWATPAQCTPPTFDTIASPWPDPSGTGPYNDGTDPAWANDPPRSIAPTLSDVDPDGSFLAADNCWLDVSGKSEKDNVTDSIDRRFFPVVLPVYRWTRVYTFIHYKWCRRRISSTAYHVWYTPLNLFIGFEMLEKKDNGEFYRYSCGGNGYGFDHFEIDPFFRDGNGTTVNPDKRWLNCIPNGFRNNWTMDLNQKKLVETSTFGYPKWEIWVHETDKHWPDTEWDQLTGRLNPDA